MGTIKTVLSVFGGVVLLLLLLSVVVKGCSKTTDTPPSQASSSPAPPPQTVSKNEQTPAVRQEEIAGKAPPSSAPRPLQTGPHDLRLGMTVPEAFKTRFVQGGRMVLPSKQKVAPNADADLCVRTPAEGEVLNSQAAADLFGQILAMQQGRSPNDASQLLKSFGAAGDAVKTAHLIPCEQGGNEKYTASNYQSLDQALKQEKPILMQVERSIFGGDRVTRLVFSAGRLESIEVDFGTATLELVGELVKEFSKSYQLVVPSDTELEYLEKSNTPCSSFVDPRIPLFIWFKSLGHTVPLRVTYLSREALKREFPKWRACAPLEARPVLTSMVGGTPDGLVGK